MVSRSATRRSVMVGGLRCCPTCSTTTPVIRPPVVPPVLESTVTRVVNGSIHRTPTVPVAVASGSRSTAAGDVGWRLQVEANPSISTAEDGEFLEKAELEHESDVAKFV